MSELQKTIWQKEEISYETKKGNCTACSGSDDSWTI